MGFKFTRVQIGSWTSFGSALCVRMPGVEPGAQAWGACMLLLHYMGGLYVAATLHARLMIFMLTMMLIYDGNA